MKLVLLPLLASALTAFPLSASAQSAAYEAGRRLGESLARGSDEAYQRGLERQLDTEIARLNARNAYLEEQIRGIQEGWKPILEKTWIGLGVPQDEAKSIASTFKLEDAQIAINERVNNQGWRSGIDAAIQAYRRFDYQLGNQLLVAANLAMTSELKAKGELP